MLANALGAGLGVAVQKNVDDSLRERITLTVSCRNLKNLDVISKSDPQVFVYSREAKNPNWIEIGKTERVTNNLNPDFSN